MCTSIAISHGVGKHLNALQPTDIPPAILWGIVATDLGILADTIPKLAVALLINKVLAPSRIVKSFFIAITTVLICFAVVLVVMSFVSLHSKKAWKILTTHQVQCQPIEHQWEREKVAGSCWTPLVFAYFGISVGIYSTLIDFIFCLYPPIIVSRLHMQLRKKLVVMVVFGLAIFTLFATLYKTASELPKLRYERVDFPRVVGQVILWTDIEASVVIIAGSIPTWGWLFRTNAFEKLISWLTLHSHATNRESVRLPSKDGEPDEESMRGGAEVGREDGKKRYSGSVALQSIERIERTAFS